MRRPSTRPSSQIDYQDPETGKALFNLDVAGGAYACARCHTRGWSIIPDSVEPPDADLSAYAGFPDGSGALGPNLTGGLVDRQFASVEELALFVSTGSVDGEAYGNNGIGSGKMPGFGDNPNTENVENDGMMTQEMIGAIARYEDSLPPADTHDERSTARAVGLFRIIGRGGLTNDAAAHHRGRHRLGPHDPGHPRRPHGGHRAGRRRLPAAGHQPRPAARVPGDPHGAVRLDDDPRPGLVALPAGSGPHRATSRRGRSRRSTTATSPRRCSSEAHDLDPSELPSTEEINDATDADIAEINEQFAGQLNEWKLLAASDASRAEAQSTADATLTEGVIPGLEETTSYVHLYTFETGGKPERESDGVWDRVTNRITNTLRITSPPHYAIVQIQPAIPQEEVVGQAPPPPEADPNAEVISIVMVRDLGQRRLVPALITLGSGLMFGLLCAILHARDRVVAEHRSAPLPAPTGGG